MDIFIIFCSIKQSCFWIIFKKSIITFAFHPFHFYLESRDRKSSLELISVSVYRLFPKKKFLTMSDEWECLEPEALARLLRDIRFGALYLKEISWFLIKPLFIFIDNLHISLAIEKYTVSNNILCMIKHDIHTDM